MDKQVSLQENLLVDCDIKSIRERLQLTLANIRQQKGVMMWDDEEKLEHCILALQVLEHKAKVPKFPPYIYVMGKKLKLSRVFNEDETPDWDSYVPQAYNPTFKHVGKFHALYLDRMMVFTDK